MSDLYRLVYASKNLLQGSDAEIAEAVSQILDASRRNNARVAVTGALMFNAGAFAQVLEGPKEGVETTFERIQCDPRHSDVTVLQCGPVESRTFTNWSMAFVGQSVTGRARWDGLAAASGFDLSRLDGDAVFAMLHGLVLEEEGLPAAASPPAEPARPGGMPGAGMDVERVRAELPQVGRAPQAVQEVVQEIAREAVQDAGATAVPEQAAAGRAKEGIARAGRPDAALAVLRAALAQERQITTDLRNELDAVRIALALEQELSATLRGERDLWARRAQVLATAMSREAAAVAKDAAGADSAEAGWPDRAGGAIRAVA